MEIVLSTKILRHGFKRVWTIDGTPIEDSAPLAQKYVPVGGGSRPIVTFRTQNLSTLYF